MTDSKRDKSGGARVPPSPSAGAPAGLVKLFYRIGEVALIVGVAPHVLRYWESEFPTLKPQKSNHGQRVYTKRDVHKLLLIKHMLKEQGLTIAGARKQLRTQGAKLFTESDSSETSAKFSSVAAVVSSNRDEALGVSPDVRPLATPGVDVRQVPSVSAPYASASLEGSDVAGPSSKSLRTALLSVRRELIDWLSDLQ